MIKHLARFAWDRRDLKAWVAALVLALLGFVVSVSIVPNLFFADVQVDAITGSICSTYSTKCLLSILVIGILMIVLGWRLGTDHVALNWGLVAGGTGTILLGVTWLAWEKVELTRDALTVRSWWGLYRLYLPLAEISELPEEHHQQAWRRRPQWRSLHYRMKDGRTGTLSSDIAHHPLWSATYPYLLRLHRIKGQR